jgi:hypothetical protein
MNFIQIYYLESIMPKLLGGLALRHFPKFTYLKNKIIKNEQDWDNLVSMVKSTISKLLSG